jgi:ABC-type polysaccharide/polyol phosphate export permease
VNLSTRQGEPLSAGFVGEENRWNRSCPGIMSRRNALKRKAPFMREGSVESSRNWTIYTSDMHSGAGFVEAWTSLVRDLSTHRFLMWQLFKKDFKAQYQQSYLGILWSVLLPLLPIAVYVFMVRIGVLRVDDISMPYLVFVVVGLTLWRILSDGITIAMNKVIESKAMLGKIRIPKIVIIFSGMGQVCFETAVRSSVVVAVAWYYGMYPSPWALAFVPALIPWLCLTMAVGMLASVFNMVFRDVEKFLAVALTYAMFLCSVVFVMPESGPIGFLNQFNPMNTFVVGLRELLFVGPPVRPMLFVVTCLGSVLALLVACRIFYVLEYVVHDRL